MEPRGSGNVDRIWDRAVVVVGVDKYVYRLGSGLWKSNAMAEAEAAGNEAKHQKGKNRKGQKVAAARSTAMTGLGSGDSMAPGDAVFVLGCKPRDGGQRKRGTRSEADKSKY